MSKIFIFAVPLAVLIFIAIGDTPISTDTLAVLAIATLLLLVIAIGMFGLAKSRRVM